MHGDVFDHFRAFSYRICSLGNIGQVEENLLVAALSKLDANVLHPLGVITPQQKPQYSGAAVVTPLDARAPPLAPSLLEMMPPRRRCPPTCWRMCFTSHENAQRRQFARPSAACASTRPREPSCTSTACCSGF